MPKVFDGKGVTIQCLACIKDVKEKYLMLNKLLLFPLFCYFSVHVEEGGFVFNLNSSM